MKDQLSYLVTHSLSLDTDTTQGQPTIITKPSPALIKDKIPLLVTFYYPRAFCPLPKDYVKEGAMLPKMIAVLVGCQAPAMTDQFLYHHGSRYRVCINEQVAKVDGIHYLQPRDIWLSRGQVELPNDYAPSYSNMLHDLANFLRLPSCFSSPP